MTVPIDKIPTIKLPAFHDETTLKRAAFPQSLPTMKLPAPSLDSPMKMPWKGTYDENMLVRSIKIEYRQGGTWLPVVIFASAVLLWVIAAWVISANFYAIEWIVTLCLLRF